MTAGLAFVVAWIAGLGAAWIAVLSSRLRGATPAEQAALDLVDGGDADKLQIPAEPVKPQQPQQPQQKAPPPMDQKPGDQQPKACAEWIPTFTLGDYPKVEQAMADFLPAALDAVGDVTDAAAPLTWNVGQYAYNWPPLPELLGNAEAYKSWTGAVLAIESFRQAGFGGLSEAFRTGALPYPEGCTAGKPAFPPGNVNEAIADILMLGYDFLWA